MKNFIFCAVLATNYLLQKKYLATAKLFIPKRVFLYGIDVNLLMQKK